MVDSFPIIPMSLAKDIETDAVQEGIIFPVNDLYSDEPPSESELHLRQLILLIQSLEWWWRDRQDFYAFGNLTIYYSPRQRRSEHFRGPDFFVVLDTERKPRKSWVVWEEGGQYPNFIVEILSSTTAATDRGLKKQIFQNIFRTPDYFWFDPESLEFKGFHLVDGQYEDLEPNERGLLWSKQLNLYLGIVDSNLRFFSPEGELIPTLMEVVEQSQDQLAQERDRADRLAQKLRELGVDIP